MVILMDYDVIIEYFKNELNMINAEERMEESSLLIKFNRNSINPHQIYIDYDDKFQYDDVGFTVIDGIETARYRWASVKVIEVYYKKGGDEE